jgi:hypothetical protein
MTPREQLTRTVAAMTDEECAVVFPQIRIFWLAIVASVPTRPPTDPARIERIRRSGLRAIEGGAS